ncbi:hypothetical protein Phum_PHUM068180 [Pediculus humanus corporis]|uniref:Uncharacterized protein n=1 Tax=Pediculus humanus subsp. corporis TaxID=121224 RepID=E0VBT0_PEDHC|nr:uncharacterized protein Phum_PHUM068180 [Pediculus humanus corporis]EEB10836.1 hypothetical protein Phum_PHUM068180 [Pediculus humanus corporis]
MIATKFLGILAASYFIVVRETIAQNFYPARYGKRDESGDGLIQGKRLDRNDDQNAINDRKIRFFISGGRYGKRGCTSEVVSGEYQNDQERNNNNNNNNNRIINIPMRKNPFMVGSRFGKRIVNPNGNFFFINLFINCYCFIITLIVVVVVVFVDLTTEKTTWCIFIRINDSFKCLTKTELDEEQMKFFDSSFPLMV